jgi:tetratricopeptide (TPR) repeat protein
MAKMTERNSANVKRESDAKAPATTVQPAIPSPAAALFRALPQSAQAIRTDGLEVYQTRLGRAVQEYNIGHFGDAEATLNGLLPNLEQALESPASGGGDAPAQLHLLYATALTVHGRTLEGLGREKESGASFRKAVSEFLGWVEAAGVTPTDQLYSDYGVALFKTGSKQQALKAFRKAEEYGALNAEANRYMGICLAKTGKAAEAKKRFSEALRQDPADFLTRKAMAECLEKEGEAQAALEHYLDAASDMWDAGRADEARGVLEHTVKEYGDESSYVFLGYVLRESREQKRAVACLDEGLKRHPRSARIAAVKGLALFDLEKFSEAALYLERSRKLSPSLRVGWNELGESYYRLGEVKKALRVADATLKATPDDAEALALKGRVLVELGQYQEATQAFRRSIEQDPASAPTYVDLGAALYYQGEYKAALEQLDEALARQPDYVEAFRYKGEIFRLQEKYQDAVQALNQALTLNPKDAWALALKGQVLHILGRNEEAVEALRKGLNLDPKLTWAEGELCSTLYDLGDYEGTLRTLEAVVRKDVNWLVFQGFVLCEIAEFEAGAKAFKRALKLNKKNAEAHANLGFALVYFRPPRVKEALAAYESALESEPKNLWWEEGCANCLYILGEGKEVERKYKSVLKGARALYESKREREMAALIGWCELRLGEYEQAARLFAEGLSIKPNVSDMFDFALSLMCGGHYEEAAHEYARALRAAGEKPELRRRGLIFVARDDLRLMARRLPALSGVAQVEEVLDRLTKVFDELPAYRPGKA